MKATTPPLFPGCETITDNQEKQIRSSESFATYLRERLEDDNNNKGKVAIRLYIDTAGKIERSEIHPKSHPVLAEQVAMVILQMQKEGFRWVPGHKEGKPIAFPLEFMLNFGTTCHNPM